jgi:hypothetical protein
MTRAEGLSKHVSITVQQVSEPYAITNFTVTAEHLVVRMRGATNEHLELLPAGGLAKSNYVPMYAKNRLVPARVISVERLELHHRDSDISPPPTRHG